MESDFSGSNIDVRICCIEEWLSQNEGGVLLIFHIKYHKVNRDETVPHPH
jgi:hypothetical protein